MIKKTKKNVDVLNESSLFDCREEEFEVLSNYFIDAYSGKKSKDPRKRMFFCDGAMKKRAKEYASCVQTIVAEFSGKVTK